MVRALALLTSLLLQSPSRATDEDYWRICVEEFRFLFPFPSYFPSYFGCEERRLADCKAKLATCGEQQFTPGRHVNLFFGALNELLPSSQVANPRKLGKLGFVNAFFASAVEADSSLRCRILKSSTLKGMRGILFPVLVAASTATSVSIGRRSGGVPLTGQVPKSGKVPVEAHPLLHYLCRHNEHDENSSCEVLSSIHRASEERGFFNKADLATVRTVIYPLLRTAEVRRVSGFQRLFRGRVLTVGPTRRGGQPKIPWVLQRAFVLAAELDFPLVPRLAKLVATAHRKQLTVEIYNELQFLEDFAPVASAMKAQQLRPDTPSHLAPALYVSLPRFSAGRWPETSPGRSTTKADYAKTLARDLTDKHYGHNLNVHEAVLEVKLPRLFLASLGAQGAEQPEACALRYALWSTGAEGQVDRIDRLAEEIVRASPGRMGEWTRFADAVEAGERLLGWYWLTNERVSESLVKLAIAGRLVGDAKGRAKRLRNNMNDLCTALELGTVMCTEFALSDPPDPYVMLKKYGIGLPVLYYVMLVAAVPSHRVLRPDTVKAIQEHPGDGEQARLPTPRLAALDPLSLYFCHRGIQAKCRVFAARRKLARNLFETPKALLEAADAVWESLKKFGEPRRFTVAPGDKAERRDIIFFKGIATLDPTPWFVEGRKLKGGLQVVMYDFFRAGVMDWPLFHRILRKYAADAEQIENIIREEFAMFEYLHPFLQNMHIYCKYAEKYCQSLYPRYTTLPPAENADATHYAATYFLDLAKPMAGTGAAESEVIGAKSQSAKWGQRWGHWWIKRRSEDPEFPNALQPQAKFEDIRGEHIYWVRLTDILMENHGSAELFGDINPEQFGQGSLGDCWLVAALSSAAEYPEFVKSLFDTKEINDRGEYTVNINEGNEAKKVKVNDLIPCFWNDSVGYRPAFLRPTGNAMWALLYEKAFAKHRGGYGFLDGGTASEAFQAFNQEPIANFLNPGTGWVRYGINRVNIREVLKSFLTVGYFVSASIIGTRGQVQLAGTGLVPGHQYTVLRIAILGIADGRKITLIKLRNPWGETEWAKEWSDFSAEWWKYDEAKLLQHKPANDGVFWMPLNRFLQYFNDIEVSCTILQSTKARQTTLALP